MEGENLVRETVIYKDQKRLYCTSLTVHASKETATYQLLEQSLKSGHCLIALGSGLERVSV